MKKKRCCNREALQGWLSILPVLIIIVAVRGVPVAAAVIKSFTNWDGMLKSDFVGLKNYIQILGHGEFWGLFRNNLVLLIYIPIQIFIGVVVAVLLYEEVKGWKIFRTIYYIPQVVSSLIVGFLFAIFFGFNGPINTFLRAVGMDGLAIEWLGQASSGLGVIIFCLVWINIGWQGMLVLGGLASVSPDIYEAARLDGAGYWQKLFLVTLPLLRRTIEYSVMVSVIWSFTSLFPLIYSLTRGGPGTETMTIDYMIYQKSFVSGSQMGYSCAMSVILLVIILIFTGIQQGMSQKKEREEGAA